MVRIKKSTRKKNIFHIETSIPDVAIEHRQFLYSQDQPSSITCRSKIDLYPIQSIDIDDGCMI
jgi:hypothetical protein